MNAQNFIENLFAGIVCTAVCALARRIYIYIKDAEANIGPPKTPTPAKTLQKQFLISLFTLVISLPAAFMFPISKQPTLLGAIGIFLFIIAGFSFLIVWGAFDASFAFYPKDDGGDQKSADKATNHTTQD